MSKIIRTRKPSVLPYYAAALAFVVLCAVLPVYRLWALLAALGAAVLAFAGAKKICPPRVVETEVPFHTGVDDVAAMLTEMLELLANEGEDAAFAELRRRVKAAKQMRTRHHKRITNVL